MHSKNVIHCDISARNCLIDSFLRAYVSDFGMSLELAEGATQALHVEGKAIPIRWCAPETIALKRNSRQSYSYMFAMLLCEVLGRQAPYQNCAVASNDELIVGILDDKNPLRPVIPDWCPVEIAEVMAMSWVPDPAARLTMTQINSRLTDYMDKCFRARSIGDVYKPFKVTTELAPAPLLSLEQEMTLYRSVDYAKRTHYMDTYKPQQPTEAKVAAHVHTDSCGAQTFGASTGSQQPGVSLSARVDTLQRELTVLTATHKATVEYLEQLRAEHQQSLHDLEHKLRTEFRLAIGQWDQQNNNSKNDMKPDCIALNH